MKKSQSVSFKSATIDIAEGTITEVLKDSTNEFKLADVLAEWDGVENISIVIKKDTELES